MQYRMAVDASVCFSVYADSEAEAVEKAKRVMLSMIDGMDVDGFTDDEDARAYFIDDATPSVEDADDASPAEDFVP